MNGSSSNTSGATVATLAFTPKDASDQISDAIFAEIQRRLAVTFETNPQGDIYGGTTAPADKTLIWWPIDPTTGARIGQPQTFNATTNAWVALGSDVVIPPQPQRIFGNQTVATGASVVTVTFTPLRSQTVNYNLEIMPSTDLGSAPANMNNFGYIITNKANNQFVLSIFGVPTNMTSFDWSITENLPN